MAVRPNQNRKREVAPLGISPPMPAHSPLFSAPLMLANGGKIALADDPLASLFLAEGGAVQSGFRGSIIEPSNFQTTSKSLLGNNRTIGTGLRGKSDGFGFRERLPEPEIPISSPQDPLAPTLVVPLTTTVATPTTPNTPIQDSGNDSDVGSSQGSSNMGLDDDVMGQSVGPGGSDTAGDSTGGGPGCVIATHGVSTGGFTVMEKTKAELWCQKTYHGKWYGEAFRKGYRDFGLKRIKDGTVKAYYQEFKDFVGYGRRVKKGWKLAFNYYYRTITFFITGLFIGDK